VEGTDGRVRRGARNREAIVDAALALVAEERTLPGAAAIAGRAGVATRSVFHHFPTMQELLAVAAETQGKRHWHVLQPPRPGAGLDERIADAVAQRAELFEAIGDVRRVAAGYEPGFPLLAERLQESRALLRRHVRRALQPQLASLDRAAVEGIQAVASFETWEVLRRHQGLSIAAARAAVVSVIGSVVDGALVKEA
jgi:TetR/AcrR family transcriptional regulator of autoinduction and epiphytic fitness